MVTIWMRFLMMKTWTWFHPKPWAPLCAAASTAHLAPRSDVGAATRTFWGSDSIFSSLVDGAKALLFLMQVSWCMLPEEVQLWSLMQDCKLLMLRLRSYSENAEGHESKPYPLWLQSLTNCIYLSCSCSIILNRNLSHRFELSNGVFQQSW